MLDDVRDPKDCYLHGEKKKLVDFSGIPAGSWNIVRDYDQFIFKIKKYGIPLAISFDNDLAPQHYKDYQKAALSGYFDWQFVQPKMGLHALTYILELCKKENKKIPKIYIHTANHFARAEMERILGLESSAELKSDGGIIIS